MNRPRPLRGFLSERVVGALLGCGAFLLPVAAFWGFSVDDAWIVARTVARGWQEGRYSFHAWRSDAITPLGFEWLVGGVGWVLGRSSIDGALFAARLVSAVSMFLAAAVVGAGLGGRPTGTRCLGFAWLSFLVGAGAYASAGLETGLVALLVTAGGRFAWGSGRATGPDLVLLGLASGLRPELAPVCTFLAAWGFRGTTTFAGNLRYGGFLLGFAVVPTLRLALHGTVLPLSFQAKAPEWSHGVRYALGALVLAGPGLLSLAAPRRKRTLVLGAAGVHLLSVGVAGGDWMPLHRLIVPLQFWMVGAVFAVDGEATLRDRALKTFWTVCGATVAGTLAFAYATDSRAVVERRKNWIARGETLLAGATAVATVDLGWVSAAFPGEVVDLAGITDPRVAALPGGHTSKRLSPGFLAGRNVDAWVVRDGARAFFVGAQLRDIRPTYAVDARLLPHAEDLGFKAVGTIAIEGTSGQYVVLRAR